MGSIVISLLDMIGVLAMLPMMQLVSGAPTDVGALGWVSDLLGTEDQDTLVIALAAFIVGAFAVKDVAAIMFRIWQLRFMADQEVATSTRILRGYLVGPYAWHLKNNTGDKIWTIESAVGIGFITGIGSALALVTETFAITMVFVGLLIAAPFASLLALVYFGAAALVLQRVIRPRINEASKRSQAAGLATSTTSLQALGAFKEIKLRGADAQFVTSYREARHVGAHARATAGLLHELPKYLLEIAFVLGIALLAFAVTTTSDAQQGIVTLGLFVAAGSRILPSIVRFLGSLSGVRFSRGPLEHLIRETRMQAAAEREQEAAVRTTDVPRGDIEVRGVTFAYADQPDELVAARRGRDDPQRSVGGDRRLQRRGQDHAWSTCCSACTSLVPDACGPAECRSSTTCRPGRPGWRWCRRTCTSSMSRCASTSRSTRSRTTTASGTPCTARSSRTSSLPCRTGSTARSASAGSVSPEASASGSASLARSTATRRCSCSTRPRPPSTTRPSAGSPRRCRACGAT